jgi:hypothetical protein
MQRTTKVAAALAAAFTLGACVDGATPKARVTEPEVLADFVSVSASCTNSAFSGYRRNALDYSSLRNDPVGDLVSTLGKATTDAARKTAAMNVLARLDEIRSTGLAKLPIDGAKAAVAAIGCGRLLTTGIPTDAQMASAMDLGPDGGVFEVVGGPGDTRTGAAIAPGAATKWGAEPYLANASLASVNRISDWATAFPTERVLLYAFRIPNLTGFEGIPLDPSSVVFDMSTAPLIDPVANTVNIFVCAGDDFSRIQSRQFIMTPWEPRYCQGAAPLASQNASEGFGSKLLAWITPKPAYASMLLIGTGGVKSGWSPKGLVRPAVNSFVLELVTPMQDASLSTNGGSFDAR